jgi:zinc protease
VIVRNLRLLTAATALAVLVTFGAPRGAAAADLPVTRATLSNGLQVIVVSNPLAPVVTAIMNYRTGSNDQTVDGLAHATEHMMFRGSKTLSSSQLMDSVDITGGDFDADTEDAVTQYFFTVPTQYMDIAMRLERSRATGLLMSQKLWNQERGAITQEVTADNSNAIYRLFVKMQNRLVAGTPYAKNGLGTVFGFAHQVNSQQLLGFYKAWYHPNNATYIIVGDVDGPSTIAKVRQIFGDVPAAKLPKRAAVHLSPVTSTVYHDTSDQPFTAVLLGYRLPGYDSPDYEAGQILSDIFNSQRGDLYALQASGKAYATQMFVQPYAKTAVGIVLGVVPITTKPEVADGWLRGVIDSYRKNGVPADLVAAAKLREVSQLEFNADSIENQAFQWSQAVAVQGQHSPSDSIAAFQKVTTDDVNRVLRASMDNSRVVAAYAVPKNVGKLSIGGGPGKEDNSIPPSHHEPLPSWAQAAMKNVQIPKQTLAPVAMTLSNGVKLIVQPETVTNTVSVAGRILNNAQVQEPVGKDGVAGITASLLPYGTATYDRLALQAEQDKIAATVQSGTEFSLEALSDSFDRGVQLLADEELHPRFDPKDFAIVQGQAVQGAADEANSPDHLTEVALANALYPTGDPARRFATPATAKAVTLSDVKAWYASAYRPDLTTIVVVGNVTPDQAKASFEKYFSGWTASGPTPNVYPPPLPNNGPTNVVVPATGRVQAQTQMVEAIGILRGDPDWPTMQVANTILSGGFYSSLLYHDLREVHGYVYNVYSNLNVGKTRSTFTVGFGSDPQNVAPADGQVRAILHMMQLKPIEADRLQRAKAQLMGEIPINVASYDGVGSLLLNYGSRGQPLDQNLIDAQGELGASASTVQAAMAKWIRPGDFVRVVTGPGPK